MAIAKNLIQNSSFESGSAGWTTDDAGEWSISSADSFVGIKSVKQVGAGNFHSWYSASGITVLPNTNYTFSVVSKAGGTSNVQINSGSAFGSNIANYNILNSSGAWTRTSLTFNTGAATLIFIRVFDTGTFTSFYDCFQLELGSSATAYQDASNIYPRPLRLPISATRAPVPRGAAYSGMETAYGSLPGVEGTDYRAITQSDFNYAAAQGWNLVRVACSWPRLQPTRSAAFNTTYQTFMDNALTYAGIAGVKVLFEFHDFGGHNGNKINGGVCTYADFNDLATRCATRWGSNANLWGIDPMNEPNGMPVGTNSSNYNTTATWTVAMQGFINAWRAVDVTKYIVAETDNFASLSSFTNDYGTNPTPWWTDSANKLYISFHCYFDHDNSGSYSGADKWQSGSGLTINNRGDLLQNAVNWANNNNAKVNGLPAIFPGEYEVDNTVNDPAYLTALHDFLTVMDINQLPGTAWAFGPWYASSPNCNSGKYSVPILNLHLGTLN